MQLSDQLSLQVCIPRQQARATGCQAKSFFSLPGQGATRIISFPLFASNLHSLERKSIRSMKSFRPKLAMAATLGLLMLLGGCTPTNGQSDHGVMSGTEPSKERSSISRMLDTIFDAMKGWTEPEATKEKPENLPEEKEIKEELPNKTSFTKPAGAMGAKLSHLSLIELEAKKAKALQDQRMGIPCIDCVDDGEGNLLPANLVESMRMQRKKTHVDVSQTQMNDSTSHDQKNHEDNYASSIESTSLDEDRSKLAATSARRQLSKSKNVRVVAPRAPFPSDCRCEYPSENIYRFPTQNFNQFRGGLLILPGSSIYCRDVAFICDLDDRPPGSVEFRCPNLNPPIIVNPKGKGKGNKNRNNIIVGNPGFGGGIIIGDGGSRRLNGESLSDTGSDKRKLDDTQRRNLSGSETRKLNGATSRRRSLSKVRFEILPSMPYSC